MRGVILLFMIQNIYLVSIPLPGIDLLGGEHGGLGEGMEALNPFPIPCPMHVFHLAVPKLYPFIISW